MNMAAAAVNAAQNVANAALAQALGTPTQRILEALSRWPGLQA
jgi:hypothetical protein